MFCYLLKEIKRSITYLTYSPLKSTVETSMYYDESIISKSCIRPPMLCPAIFNSSIFLSHSNLFALSYHLILQCIILQSTFLRTLFFSLTFSQGLVVWATAASRTITAPFLGSPVSKLNEVSPGLEQPLGIQGITWFSLNYLLIWIGGNLFGQSPIVLVLFLSDN